MAEQSFSYEAKGRALIIHLPKELDHHNCKNLKHETDLLLSENYPNSKPSNNNMVCMPESLM